MAVDNSLHKRALEISLAEESVQEKLLVDLLALAFQVAKEGMPFYFLTSFLFCF